MLWSHWKSSWWTERNNQRVVFLHRWIRCAWSTFDPFLLFVFDGVAWRRTNSFLAHVQQNQQLHTGMDISQNHLRLFTHDFLWKNQLMTWQLLNLKPSRHSLWSSGFYRISSSIFVMLFQGLLKRRLIVGFSAWCLFQSFAWYELWWHFLRIRRSSCDLKSRTFPTSKLSSVNKLRSRYFRNMRFCTKGCVSSTANVAVVIFLDIHLEVY